MIDEESTETKRCPRHEWQPAFQSADGLIDLYLGINAWHNWVDYRRCVACGAFGVLRLDRRAVRPLSAQEAGARDIQRSVDAWEQHIQKWVRFIAAGGAGPVCLAAAFPGAD